MFKNLIFLFCALWALQSFARDLLVLKGKNCQFYEGIILDIQDKVIFLDVNGKISYLNEDEIQTVMTYGISQSPFFRDTKFDGVLKSYIKTIALRNDTKIIIGIPFQYIEDLVFIINKSGKIIVVSLSEIKSISDTVSFSRSAFKSKKQVFPDYSEQLIECDRKVISQNKELRSPVRILGDKLKLSEYFRIYKKGVRSFKDLQERIHFYAKPYLFPRRNRMGITQIQNSKLVMPFYYQWSTGSDFHFQSVNQFGGVVSRYLPSFETNNVFTSEFKSHFFHGYFEGNLGGISAGIIPRDYEDSAPSDTAVRNNFNYFGFMGGDWQNFSISYGGGYFVPFYQLEKYETREVGANAISNAIRIGYTGYQFKLNLIGYLIDDSTSSSFELKDQLRLESKNNMDIANVNKAEHNAKFIRLGGEIKSFDDLVFQANLLLGSGEYKESGTEEFSLEFKRTASLLGITKQFGHYITLTLYQKSDSWDIDSKLNGKNKSFSNNTSTYGGVFELLF